LWGDTNLDGSVDNGDLNKVGLNWQLTGDWRGHALTWSQGNFNGDNIVDSQDLNQIGNHWRESIALASSVPEPCFNWELLLLTCAAYLVRRFPSTSP
jgi:hypothetical protein